MHWIFTYSNMDIAETINFCILSSQSTLMNLVIRGFELFLNHKNQAVQKEMLVHFTHLAYIQQKMLSHKNL